MLTRSDVELAIKSLKLYSSCGFYPIGIQEDGLPAATSPQRRFKAWRYLLWISVLYTIFMAARLGQAMGSEDTNIIIMSRVQAAPLHVITLVGGIAANVTYVLLWRLSTLWLNVCLLRDLLSGLPQGDAMPHFKVFKLVNCKPCFIFRKWKNME